MAKRKYTVSSPEGAAWATGQAGGVPVEEGAELTLELDADQETAMVAAGWLAPPEPKSKGGDK